MFEMFKDLGQMAGLLRQLPKIREEIDKFQQQLGRIVGEGVAGGGLVKARANGRGELLGVTLSDEAMALKDREMLEDLVTAAVNQAIDKAREGAAEEAGKMGANLGLPPGMGLPGLGS